MSHRDRSIANMRCEAKRIYHQRRYINKLEKDKKDLQEKINTYENPEDLTLMFMYCEEKTKDKIKELQQRIDRAEECIKTFLCSEEYIIVDGTAIADNYAAVLEILKGGSHVNRE